MEQHYPYFKMPKNYDYHLTSNMNLLDKLKFEQYLMGFSGYIPPEKAEGMGNMIVNGLQQAKQTSAETLDKMRVYIAKLPQLIYLLEEPEVSFDEITAELKKEGFTPEDIATLSRMATTAKVAERAGQYTIATNPKLDRKSLKAIQTIDKIVALEKHGAELK